ncbi:single-stranded DNA-binding protein [Pseudactinotalea suaedae]
MSSDMTETDTETPVPGGAENDATDAVADKPAGEGEDTSRLEAEGDIAADYLEELLDIADIDGDIDIDIDHGRAAVEIVSEEDGGRGLRRLVGDDGEVLDALQELTRLAVQARTGDRSRLMLDIAGHRQARRNALTELANEAIAQVQTGNQDVSLQAMNPFERKVVHDAVAAAGLVSDSEGVEPNRRVVIRARS